MTEFEKFQMLLNDCADQGAIAGRLFGKHAIKNARKAAVLLSTEQECVFRLEGLAHAEAMALEGATLYDPSGKNRPMKAWVVLPWTHEAHFLKLAKLALDSVGD